MSPTRVADDTALVRHALRAAHAAVGTRDVPIGAVVADPAGNILSSACNARERLGDPTAHAEILALRAAAASMAAASVAAGSVAAGSVAAGWRLDGCTVAITVEPCTMCAGALVLARVARVVFGAWEPRTGAAGSLWDVVRDRRLNHRPEVVGPDILGPSLASECTALLDAFFAAQR